MANSLGQQPKEKRSKMELYYAVLCAIRDELTDNKYVKPTRIQFLVGTSYDKLILYLDELEVKKLVKLDPITITEKGKKFVREYDKINEMTIKLGLKFID
ncbi:MAG: transcriptional regulator [Nitrosarchaeum sp.]|nr:transcriptional regulator [Nitrosarchaeum sp.]